MKFIKRIFCEHKLRYVRAWARPYSIGLGKYERTEYQAEIVSCCEKCGKIIRFDTYEEFKISKEVSEIRNNLRKQRRN